MLFHYNAISLYTIAITISLYTINITLCNAISLCNTISLSNLSVLYCTPKLKTLRRSLSRADN